MSNEKPAMKRTFSNKMFGKKDVATGEDKKEEKPLKRTFSNKMFGKKDEGTGEDAAREEAGASEKPVMKRTFSNKMFGKKDEATGEDKKDKDEKVLKRTFSNKMFGKKDEASGEDKKEEKPVMKRTFSNKMFGKKDEATGEDVASSDEKPVLKRTLSTRFGKSKEEKKKLKLKFDIRVVRVSKCQINNTTVFLGWQRPVLNVGGDTKRAVVTECSAMFGDTISVDAVLSSVAGEDKFKPSPILFELKEDKLVRKGAGKAKWNVLGRGELDLAEYAKASKSLVIIPLLKKKTKIAIQLELEVTAVWQHFDGFKFEKIASEVSAASAAAPSGNVPESPSMGRQKKVEFVGSSKYAVVTDSEADVYTEEEVDLNLSEIVSDDDEQDYKSAFANTSNPFEKDDDNDDDDEETNPFGAPPSKDSSSASFSSMLMGLSGGTAAPVEIDPPRPKREAPKKDEEVATANVVEAKKEEPKKAEEVSVPRPQREPPRKEVSAEKEEEEPVLVSSTTASLPPTTVSATTTTTVRPFNPLTTCHDCKRENKIGWKFCDTCGARSKAPQQEAPPKEVVVALKKEVVVVKHEEYGKQPEVKPAEKKVDAKPAEVVKVDVKTVEKKPDPVKAEPAKKVEEKKQEVAEKPIVVSSTSSSSSSSSSKSLEEMRQTIDQQRREIQMLKDNERKFSNTITMAERKALAAESLAQAKERELKRMSVQRSGNATAVSEEVEELTRQILELETELAGERRRREFAVMMENLVFLCTFTFTKENESVAALKIFDEFIRLGVFDESLSKQNIPLMDHMFHTIVLLCQNSKVPQEITQYWVVTAVHLLKLIRDGKKRLKTAVRSDHPLMHLERELSKLATNLYTRLFTFMLRKIESLLVRSLGVPFQSEAYFRPDELAMGEILREFAALFSGFKSNHWSFSMIELFFKFCVDLVNRFLANKIISERQYCTLLNGFKIKMEVSFLTEWLMKQPETERLVDGLDHVLEAANLLIMSKGRGSLADFRALNVRQIHSILAQYQPQKALEPKGGAGFAVVPTGISKSSQEIVDKMAKAKGGANLAVADNGDKVDPMVLRKLEEDPAFGRCEMLIPDSFSDDIEKLQDFLRE